MNLLLGQDVYREIKEENAIVQYERNQEITDCFSKMADVRVIWGGDTTIEEIRKSPLKPRAKELVFADRYSFGVINPEYIIKLSDSDMTNLARNFYNDTYLMDQNACSTPHMLFWLSKDKMLTMQAQERFWKQIYEEAKRYSLEDIKASEKYTNFCLYAAKNGENVKTGKIFARRYENVLYVITEESLPDDLCEKRGKFGLFYQCSISDLNEIKKCVEQKVQTVAVAGIEMEQVHQWIIKNRLTGIDRVVPFGKTLDIGLVWDGYDLITEMSRLIG